MFSIILTVLSISVHGEAALHLLDKLDQVLFFLPTWEKSVSHNAYLLTIRATFYVKHWNNNILFILHGVQLVMPWQAVNCYTHSATILAFQSSLIGNLVTTRALNTRIICWLECHAPWHMKHSFLVHIWSQCQLKITNLPRQYYSTVIFWDYSTD